MYSDNVARDVSQLVLPHCSVKTCFRSANADTSFLEYNRNSVIFSGKEFCL
jgi:hypothetical protein